MECQETVVQVSDFYEQINHFYTKKKTFFQNQGVKNVRYEEKVFSFFSTTIQM